MEQGVLSAKDHGTIWTKESYADFILDLEFKVAKSANSGVFLRAGTSRMCFPPWRSRFTNRRMAAESGWSAPSMTPKPQQEHGQAGG